MKYSSTVVILYATALFLGAAAFDIPPELQEIVDAAHATCKAETGVADDLVAQALKGNLADDPKLKCFLKCVMLQLHLLRDDGSLDFDLLEASLPNELKEHGAIDTMKKCMNLEGKDLCVAVYDMLMCVKTENPKLSEFLK